MLLKEREVIHRRYSICIMVKPMKGIATHEIIENFALDMDQEVITETYAIRSEEDVPDLSYDIYISSGGPGSPLDTKGLSWDTKYFELIDSIEAINKLDNSTKNMFLSVIHSK